MADPAPTFDKKHMMHQPRCISHLGHLEGVPQPYFGGLINHGYHQLPTALTNPEAEDLSMGSASKAKDRRARERLGVEPKFRPPSTVEPRFPQKHPGKTLLSMKMVVV